MDLPPLFWVTSGQASRIKRKMTQKQIDDTKRRRYIEARIENQKLAREMGVAVREIDVITGC
tara:strand:+ start:575 stop:760 length:186 start_codon:yes stop_codon:yes gene_type:complete